MIILKILVKRMNAPLTMRKSARSRLAGAPLSSPQQTMLTPGDPRCPMRHWKVAAKREFLAIMWGAIGCLLTFVPVASGQGKVYEWGTSWAASGKIFVDTAKAQEQNNNLPFPHSVAFDGEIVSASTEGEAGRIRGKITGDGSVGGSKPGTLSGTKPFELEIHCASRLVRLLTGKRDGYRKGKLVVSFIFDEQTRTLIAIYGGYAWKDNLTFRDEPNTLIQQAGPRFRKGIYARAYPYGLSSVPFDFDASAINNLWLYQHPDEPHIVPGVDCYLTPTGTTLYVTIGIANGADSDEPDTKAKSVLASEFFGSKVVLKSKADLKVLPEVRELSFPQGFQVLDAPNGKILKEINGPTTAKVRAYKEVGGQKFYISDWSYDRISEGKEPNYILSR